MQFWYSSSQSQYQLQNEQFGLCRYRMNSLGCAATEYIDRFVRLNVTRWTERITTIVTVQICRRSCHFFPFMLLSTVFSNTLSLSSSHLTRYQVSHPYKPKGRNVLLFKTTQHFSLYATKRTKVCPSQLVWFVHPVGRDKELASWRQCTGSTSL